MITKQIAVTIYVDVTIDETKFTPEFKSEFNKIFYDFDDDLDEHMKHLAQLAAREIIHSPRDFIEGYGIAADMGIKTEVVNTDMEIL